MADITITPLQVADADEMVHVLADPALYKYIGGEPPTPAGLRRFYERLAVGRSPDGATRWLNWIVREGGEPVGYVQASAPVDGARANIAWVIGTPWQGRGVARNATRLLLAELERLGVRRVRAYIHPDNLPSQRIALALGMRRTGSLDAGDEEWVAPCPPAPGHAGP